MHASAPFRCAKFHLCLLILAGPLSSAWAQGIPEPSLVMYGRVLNVNSNAYLRLGYGTLAITFRPLGGGNTFMASTVLTNLGNEFSYILRVPCETPVTGFAPSTNAIQLTGAGLTFDRSKVFWNGNLLSFAQPMLTNTSFFSIDRGRIERVDLTLSAPIVIDPLNGLPVDWELSYFGRTGIDPFADPDRDGMNNFTEYLAGTDPNDPSSALRFTEIQPITNGLQLKWLSADYKTYVIQRSTALSSGFLDLDVGIVATPPLNSYQDTSATGGGPYFYRLRLGP